MEAWNGRKTGVRPDVAVCERTLELPIAFVRTQEENEEKTKGRFWAGDLKDHQGEVYSMRADDQMRMCVFLSSPETKEFRLLVPEPPRDFSCTKDLSGRLTASAGENATSCWTMARVDAERAFTISIHKSEKRCFAMMALVDARTVRRIQYPGEMNRKRECFWETGDGPQGEDVWNPATTTKTRILLMLDGPKHTYAVQYLFGGEGFAIQQLDLTKEKIEDYFLESFYTYPL